MEIASSEIFSARSASTIGFSGTLGWNRAKIVPRRFGSGTLSPLFRSMDSPLLLFPNRDQGDKLRRQKIDEREERKGRAQNGQLHPGGEVTGPGIVQAGMSESGDDDHDPLEVHPDINDQA